MYTIQLLTNLSLSIEGRSLRTPGFGGSTPRSTASSLSFHRKTPTQPPASWSWRQVHRSQPPIAFVLNIPSNFVKTKRNCAAPGCHGTRVKQSVRTTCALSTAGKAGAARLLGRLFSQPGDWHYLTVITHLAAGYLVLGFVAGSVLCIHSLENTIMSTSNWNSHFDYLLS
jgi:hypothetical protein